MTKGASQTVKEISLTQGKVALVDDEDFEALNEHRWFAHTDGTNFYAGRKLPRQCGIQRMEHMHRVVLARIIGRELNRGEYPDHINSDGLDNRRTNLRLATSAQNQRNCRRHSRNPSSKYLGVSWDKRAGQWKAYMMVSGKQVFLGYRHSEVEAAKAREAYIVDHPELFARSNFSGE